MSTRVRGFLEGLGGEARDRVVDLVAKVPLVSEGEADRFVGDLEDVVGDAAREKVLPLVAAAGGVGTLALVLAIRNRRR